MKALEMNNLLGGRKDMNIRKMRRNIENVKACTDTSAPKISSPRGAGKGVGSYMQREEVAKNNLHLAQRIFNIMEGPGLITHLISEQRPSELHPGTLNFNNRIKEAKRIHADNLQLAARLDAVKPMFGVKNNSVSIIKPVKASTKIKLKKVPKIDGFENMLQKEYEQANSARVGGGNRKGEASARRSKSARDASTSANKMNNVLLEYTKIQGGRVIDVAVIKEPFRDRYAIFGIDIENGQRYELRMSSEEVSSILDGDILVTSVENIEVWMTLLNKVELLPVDAFTKLPAYMGEDPESGDQELPEEDVYPRQAVAREIVSTPSAPTQNRPSSKPGGRSGKNINATSVDQNHFPDNDNSSRPHTSHSNSNSGSPSRQGTAPHSRGQGLGGLDS